MARRKGFIFTNKKHSDKAIMSIILAIISIISLIIVVYLTYRRGGEALEGYGFTGILACLFALAGLFLGISAVREKDRYRRFSILGLVLNVLVLAWIGFILYLGV